LSAVLTKTHSFRCFYSDFAHWDWTKYSGEIDDAKKKYHLHLSDDGCDKMTYNNNMKR